MIIYIDAVLLVYTKDGHTATIAVTLRMISLTFILHKLHVFGPRLNIFSDPEGRGVNSFSMPHWQTF